MSKFNPFLLKKVEVLYELRLRGFVEGDELSMNELRLILRKLFLDEKPILLPKEEYTDERDGNEIRESLKELSENIKQYPGRINRISITKDDKIASEQQEKTIKTDYYNQCLKLEAKMEYTMKKLLKSMSFALSHESTRHDLFSHDYSSSDSKESQEDTAGVEFSSPIVGGAVEVGRSQILF
ncbi:hypothetical protein FQR65_LT13553 [Abscondita terminalis]|nr:hypothetical protein FQR65_LT13553 [Abscondita terminalis]